MRSWRPRSHRTSAWKIGDRSPAQQSAARPSAPNPPKFYLTGRQPLRPGIILLAFATAAAALFTVAYGLGRAGKGHFRSGDPTASRTTGAASGSPSKEDEDDDPNQIDTVVLGDAADAPVPARKRDHVSTVHATILVRLPRFGEQTGLIPDTPAGHLLYRWLAAFNQASEPALEAILPNGGSTQASAAQLALRQQNGGFNLLSAKEVQPGVLVFRLRDQTPEGVEALGTLQVRANSNLATVASFGLRAIVQARPDTTTP